MGKRITTEVFIERAKAVHGDRYDYSQAEYKRIHDHVTIICPKHGEFQQSPANHYAGKGCLWCAGNQPYTKERFIEKAREVHGDKYDYSKVEYISHKDHVTIICPEHGEFMQSPSGHFAGRGCHECGKEATGNAKRLTTEEFIVKAQAVHSNRYDHSLTEYQNSHEHLIIICKKHGQFNQSPTSHLSGSGCGECGRIAAANARRKTTEEFIVKAQAVHGDRYDYSLVDYQDSHQPIKIICSEHGVFKQVPTTHLSGAGCKKCATNLIAEKSTKSTEEFVQQARDVHGEKYDYSKTVYKKAVEKVVIICPEHGEFEQAPTGHLSGLGCRECGGNKPLTLERFVERANDLHDFRYDYTNVEFKNVESKVEIICPDHGSFHQRVMTHLKGNGCHMCGNEARGKALAHSIDRFLEDAYKSHGDKYDYSKVQYVNALSKVQIICPTHGEFQQIPSAHVRGIGCSKCGDESAAEQRTKSTEEFIREAKIIHGDRYDYSKVNYITSKEQVEITCAEHGSFWQDAANHIYQKCGCPDCAESGFNPKEPGMLYYLAVSTDDGDTLYKIGITNLNIERRFPTADRERIRVVKTWEFGVGRIAAEREAEILQIFASERYLGPDVLVGSGNTELFIRDVLELDVSGDEMFNKPVIDHHAHLTGQPKQLEFGFMGE